MDPPQHRDASPDLDNARDGFGDDEIEHEMMSGSSQSEIACLRPWTPSVYHIPLSEKAIALQKKYDRNFKIRRDYIKRKECAIKQRLDRAMADLMRERGKKDYEKPGRHGSEEKTKVPPKGKDYEKPGRHGSEEKTKVPPKGYRAILEWKGNIPVRD
ncbi:uncharacterized protein A4U43_C05F25830 [Asparagus officinalis]|uniref:Uncharacterized protein n=1 Tax=Asparagus officinalis TaxID=4686 RepID=A0A5P1EYZ6_ASPOF|nr:uncharacterized protein A4U43_C05F25830 [Asparagus officinalis]